MAATPAALRATRAVGARPGAASPSSWGGWWAPLPGAVGAAGWRLALRLPRDAVRRGLLLTGGGALAAAAAAARGRCDAEQPCLLLPPPAPGDKRYTVVLDFDETLAHSSQKKLGAKDSVVLALGDGVDIQCHVRPGARELVRGLGGDPRVELVLWTAGTPPYAHRALAEIGVAKEFDHVIARDSRWFNPVSYTKQLARLGRPMCRTLIVDNLPAMMFMNPDNGIAVPDYLGDGAEESLANPPLRIVLRVIQQMLDSGAGVEEHLQDQSQPGAALVPSFRLGAQEDKYGTMDYGSGPYRVRADADTPATRKGTLFSQWTGVDWLGKFGGRALSVGRGG